MAMVNQQLDDDNNYGSGGSTSVVDDFARVNTSNEYQMAEMERLIRLYLENIWPAVNRENGGFNQQAEDVHNYRAGGSTSSIRELAMVSTSTETEMERVIRICKETVWPMICAEINANRQNLLSVIKEKLGLDLFTKRTWNSGNRASTSGSQILQFKFMNGISTPVSTRKNIEGKDQKPLVIALIDQISGQIVTTGAEASTKIEILVLEGDCNDVEAEKWNSDEFNNNIIREWNGSKKLLQGKTVVILEEGIVSVSNISFTHNSRWKGKRNCRLGVRSVDPVFSTRVKEAITESFLVMDKRNLKYNKHVIPSLSDDVYRLYEINYRSVRYKSLKNANIKTVMDLRTFNAINPKRLKDILKVHPNEWKTIMDHVQKCEEDKGMYLYPNSRDGQKRDGVVFNVSGHLVGVVSDSQFLPCHMLSNNKKSDAQKVVVSASEHWEEVVPFMDEASLIKHLGQSNNGLNLVNPQKNHLNTPANNDFKINVIVDVTPPTGQLSQSPKRPASEHDDISISPKKPRDNHKKTRLITPATSELEVTDDNEYLKYLNLPEYGIPAQKWQSMWCAVGWISMLYSRIQSRRQMLQASDDDTIMVITNAVEHVQI